MGSSWQCVLLLMFISFLFQHEISKLRQPIAMKLCHMIGSCFSFMIRVQKFGGPLPKLFGAKNVKNLE